MTARTWATVVSPKQLAIFNQCALRHHLTVRRKHRGNYVPTSRMGEGLALHAVLRRWFRTSSVWRAGADPEVVSRWMAEELAASHYDAPTEHRLALRTVAGHAAWCLDHIPADVTVRLTERQLQTGLLWIAERPVRFQARVDLVVEHPDGEIEHIDFKTGGPQEDHWIQRGVERLVVGVAHPILDRPPTRTTTLYAETRQTDSERHTTDSFRPTRTALHELTGRMLTNDVPEPTPSARCGWCPFRDAGCPVQHDLATRRTDEARAKAATRSVASSAWTAFPVVWSRDD